MTGRQFRLGRSAGGSYLGSGDTLGGSVVVAHAAVASLDSAATLSASSRVDRPAASSLAGQATLSPAGSTTFVGSVLSTGGSTLEAVGRTTLGGSASLVSSAAVTADGGSGLGEAVLSSSATASASSTVVRNGAAAMSSSATIAASITRVVSGFGIRTQDNPVVFTRASTATEPDGDAVLSGVARYATVTPSTGLVVEEGTTNYVRNSVGAGTLGVNQTPTNWVWVAESGLTVTSRILAQDAERPGHNVWEFRIQNTSGVSDKDFWIYFESPSAGQVAAVAGETWSMSADVWTVSGVLNNAANFGVGIWWHNAATAYIGENGQDVTVPLTRTRIKAEARVAPANTAFARPGFRIYSIPDGTDFTFRIATPQLEKKAYATSYQATTGSISTRANELATLSSTSVPAPTSAWTVEGRVYVPAFIAQHHAFFTWRNSIGTPRVTLIARRNGGAGSRLGVWDTTNGWTESSVALSAAAWADIAYTYDGTTVRIYLNGSLVGSQARTFPAGTYGEVYLGVAGVGIEFLNGYISDLRISNRERTAAELAVPTYTVDEGVVGYWSFNESLESDMPQGTATFVGSGVRVYDARASLSSTGSTVSGSALDAVGVAALAGAATVAPSANVVFAAAAAPTTAAAVSAAPLLVFSAEAALAGIGTVGAKGYVPVDDYTPTTRTYVVHPRHSHSKE